MKMKKERKEEENSLPWSLDICNGRTSFASPTAKLIGP
jgi:hypothetical protein